jgi:hypothetical protein
MKKNTITFSILATTLLILAFGCKKIIFRTIECRPFSETDELNWMVGNKNDTIKFISTNNTIHKFIVADKDIIHRKKYKSDSGCGCKDTWEILYTEGTDSIAIVYFTKYVEKNPANKYEDITVVLNNTKSYFTEATKSVLNNYTVDSTVFNEVNRYTYDYTSSDQVKAIYLVKNIGIIQIDRVNGEVWKNMNLKNTISVSKDSFEYDENTCE